MANKHQCSELLVIKEMQIIIPLQLIRMTKVKRLALPIMSNNMEQIGHFCLITFYLLEMISTVLSPSRF